MATLTMPQKDGLRKINKLKTKVDECRSFEHNPPTHIYLEDGEYEYTCPSCGKITPFTINKATF